ncbi:aspartic peptidase domain-containing protein [Xylariaceae sp. FL1651]|nr:aspartic peptidase domain-containing protein [Xylariaceae sp. FL1651]
MARIIFQALLGFPVLALGAAIPVEHKYPVVTHVHAANAGLAITDNYHTLSRIRRQPGLSRTLDVLRQIYRNKANSNHANYVAPGDGPIGIDHILAELNQIEYIMKVGIGHTPYYLIPDTGSSDTWVVQEGFKCLDPYYGGEVPQEYCQFGPQFKGDFPSGKIDNQNLNISYLSGDYLNGNMGYADITVGNITVPKQQFALVNVAAFSGDGISSGILGLGLRGLTAAFTGNNPAVDSLGNLVNYSPLMETIGTSNVTSPVLSFAMSREENRSYIAFGGVPPVPTGEYTTVPIQKGTTVSGKTDYFYYDIQIDSMEWSSGARNQTARDLPNMIVDSGTTINLFPPEVAAAINAAFSPSGLQEDSMVWSVPCNAKPPTLDIVIGGKPIRTHPSSMILPETEIEGNRCLSGIGAGRPGSYILGDTFMQEIVAVFDVSEKMELKFAQRTD